MYLSQPEHKQYVSKQCRDVGINSSNDFLVIDTNLLMQTRCCRPKVTIPTDVIVFMSYDSM